MTTDESTTTTEENGIPQLNENCACCLSVPISHLALEVDMPIGGWQALFDELGVRVITDPAGRRAVNVLVARKLLARLRRQDELVVEDGQRAFSRVEPVAPAGLPALEGMSPYESMVAAGGVVSPSVEFAHGRERPNFLREEIEAGQRDLDEKKRIAIERAKERLAKQMKDSLR